MPTRVALTGAVPSVITFMLNRRADRISSTSYIAILDPDARAEVLSQVLDAAEGLPEPISIPYTTDVYVADRL